MSWNTETAWRRLYVTASGKRRCIYDRHILAQRLTSILSALNRIPGRFASIKAPEDFLDSDDGREHLDSISMVLLSVGEAFKQIDDKTDGMYLSNYPDIPWKAVIGMRHVLAHDYFDVNEKVVFNTCSLHLDPLVRTVERMLVDLEEHGAARNG